MTICEKASCTPMSRRPRNAELFESGWSAMGTLAASGKSARYTLSMAVSSRLAIDDAVKALEWW
ncbi:MAG: hypothetical protein IPF98_08605 [Gemmatimonadetes bacterium]|nr:hypothetical protein [Gemmatimonadota bacterium]MCC6773638.1 hypothetical protein [Gemmatimonadaceae bacterium]